MLSTNATLNRDSDIEIQWWSKTKKYFQVFERNEEICIKINIAEKHYKIG